MSLDATTLVERYVLESTIATGGMGTVWRARDDVLARTVAVKVLLPHLAEDAAFLSRFRREALAAARLTHPNIVAIYDTGKDAEGDGPDQHFIVMEYCGGGTLLDLLEKSGPLAAERAIDISATICEALSYAHGSGITHRDIKPANVLLTDTGTLKVADFGIAKAAFASGDIATTGTILGTVTYLSPEQAAGEEPGPAADLYSLGVVTYQLVAGRLPFNEGTDIATALSHLHRDPPPLRAIRAGVPRALDAAVMKALAKDPGSRYDSADAMRSALLSAVGSMGTSPTVGYRTPAQLEPPRDGDGTPPGGFLKTEGHRIAPIILLVIAAVIAAALIAGVATQDAGDDDGNRGGGGGNRAAGEAVQIEDARDFDPSAGDGEHPELVNDAFDDDPSTSWRTETYQASFSLIGKPGVGLVFDLGEVVSIGEITVTFDAPGYGIEIRASNEDGEQEDDFSSVTDNGSVEREQTFSIDGAEGRYWLIWITSLQGQGGGRAHIAEVEFIGG
ncbi:MAG: protein kinase domain-containing protein [Actinomycetota bacterium]